MLRKSYLPPWKNTAIRLPTKVSPALVVWICKQNRHCSHIASGGEPWKHRPQSWPMFFHTASCVCVRDRGTCNSAGDGRTGTGWRTTKAAGWLATSALHSRW